MQTQGEAGGNGSGKHAQEDLSDAVKRIYLAVFHAEGPGTRRNFYIFRIQLGSGGRLMAADAYQEAVPRFLEDLLASGRGLDAHERTVLPFEAGKTAADLLEGSDTLVLGVARAGDGSNSSERISFHRLSEA